MMENVAKKEPRGLRNNNPLNIRYVAKNRWQGKVLAAYKKDDEFEEFVTMYWGYRAAFILIFNYMNKYGRKTINDIISTWAPAHDGNATGWYIEEVAERIGIPSDQQLSFTDGKTMMQLVQEMTRVECGRFIELPPIAHGYYLACKSLGLTPNFGPRENLFKKNYDEMQKFAEKLERDMI